MKLTKKLESRQQTIYKYLIEKCIEGDRQAQNELYKLYAGAMYNVCRRMMGDEDEARDVLQDSFISAFSRLHSLNDLNLFSAWLKRIVVNHCLNAIKKKKDYIIPLEDNVDVMDEKETKRYDDMTVTRVMSAIEGLPTGARTVLSLYLFEGYDHKEIGEILNITESASKAQYSKAKSKIRNLLEVKTA